SDKQLVMAKPSGKQQAYDFLANISPGSTSQPLPAIEIAFRQEAQLIFLLTDGDLEPSNEEVIARIKELNKNGKTKINTIFLGDVNSESNKFALDAVKRIAEDNGGNPSVVSGRDF